MALPQFCTDCQSLLNDIDPGTRVAVCSSCSKGHTLDGPDRTVLIVISDSTMERSLTNKELQGLHGLPTTSRIAKVCPSCGYDTASVVHDTRYKFNLCCLKCWEQF
jgi:DNA-directed RNA polymerase subunit M/transcription elongation factor TFIIS